MIDEQLGTIFQGTMQMILGVSGAVYIFKVWIRRPDDPLLPSAYHSLLLVGMGPIGIMGMGAANMGFNPWGLGTCLSWAAVAPLWGFVFYCLPTCVGIMQPDRIVLFRLSMLAAKLGSCGVVLASALLVVGEVSLLPNGGFSIGNIASIALAALVTLVLLDIMYREDRAAYDGGEGNQELRTKPVVTSYNVAREDEIGRQRNFRWRPFHFCK